MPRHGTGLGAGAFPAANKLLMRYENDRAYKLHMQKVIKLMKKLFQFFLDVKLKTPLLNSLVVALSAGGAGFNPQSKTASYQRLKKVNMLGTNSKPLTPTLFTFFVF